MTSGTAWRRRETVLPTATTSPIAPGGQHMTGLPGVKGECGVTPRDTGMVGGHGDV
jgi:hypothetical protein